MKKLIISSVLMACAIGCSFAQKVSSEICYAINESKPLTLKYFLNSNGENCFVNLRLIVGSTDVLKQGDVLRFKCEDGSTQTITCNPNVVESSDDNGFHIASVDQDFMQHLKAGISSINITHENATYDLGLLRYTDSNTKTAARFICASVQNAYQKRQDSIRLCEMAILDSIKHREMAILDSIKHRELAILDTIKRREMSNRISTKRREMVIQDSIRRREIAVRDSIKRIKLNESWIATDNERFIEGRDVSIVTTPWNVSLAAPRTAEATRLKAEAMEFNPTYDSLSDEVKKNRRNAGSPVKPCVE